MTFCYLTRFLRQADRKDDLRQIEVGLFRQADSRGDAPLSAAQCPVLYLAHQEMGGCRGREL